MKHQLNKNKSQPLPAIVKFGKLQVMDQNIYDHSEKYIDSTETLEQGTYWMGSKTSNTRCNGFTVLGADKKRSDDTKERR